jgi:TRAP-type C4-dicarboxylate transport system substrate-binding protein
MTRAAIALAGLAALAPVGTAPARADGPVRLRMAAIAPEGTAWAREIKALSRDIETQTNGQVEMKWYLGAIAGDELTALDRIRKNQLDGMAGALFCERLAPSLWVARVVGMFQSRNEAHFVLNKLRPTLDKEIEANGFVGLGWGSFGSEVIFSRSPVRSMADLRKGQYWTWSLDELWVKELPAMGIRTLALPVEEAAQAYDEGKVDGFIGVPSAALAFQWSSRAKYFTNLSAAFLPGCIVISRRALDNITVEQQRVVRAAAAKFAIRFDDVAIRQDDALLGGLFEHQGLKKVPLEPSFVAEFYEAARRVRTELGAKLVAPALLSEVSDWVAEFRRTTP